MKRVFFFLLLGSLFMFSIPASSMMGGSGGMGGHMGGGSGWGGYNMPNNRDYNTPPTERPPAYDRYGRQRYRNNRAMMTSQVAEDLGEELGLSQCQPHAAALGE